MTKKLVIEAITKFVFGVVLVGVLIFLPAGTIDFFNGWLFMAIMFIPMFFAGIVMMFKSPELLRKRLDAKEKNRKQNIIVKLCGLMFLAGFILAGLGVRFRWYILPQGTVIGAAVVFVVAYVFYAEVLRENEYLSRTIQVKENQKVIDTGLYALVRHPMYSSTLILFLSVPLILGSVYSFLIFLLYPFVIAERIKEEEKLLEKELEGYKEYKQKVKYRMIPFVW